MRIIQRRTNRQKIVKEKIELKAPVFARTPKFKVTDLPEHERNFLVRGKAKDNISFPNGVVKRGFA